MKSTGSFFFNFILLVDLSYVLYGKPGYYIVIFGYIYIVAFLDYNFNYLLSFLYLNLYILSSFLNTVAINIIFFYFITIWNIYSIK